MAATRCKEVTHKPTYGLSFISFTFALDCYNVYRFLIYLLKYTYYEHCATIKNIAI